MGVGVGVGVLAGRAGREVLVPSAVLVPRLLLLLPPEPLDPLPLVSPSKRTGGATP